tara:strand:- start:19 stop:546 length:528 start_codon:yes stop_codon:yes gene_type:complete
MPVSSKKSQVKSGSKSSKKETVEVEVKVEKAPKTQKAGGKKTAAPKKEKKAAAPKKEKVQETETKSNVRSFKVQLPGSDTYVGRFTGLTPYQAANKALSKYFRETKKPKSEIQFSIRESTRGSKRSTYTYKGERQKLDSPVEYTISNGKGEDRTIVKKFKNRLTKVKKNELVHSA